MPSEVEIVNQALILLGDETITSLTENTTRARIANTLFGPTRDAVIRAHPWNCAIARQTLTALSAAPDFGWTYQFTLPTDPYCLRALAINDDEEVGDNGDTFKIEGRRLLANTNTADLRYIKRITDPNEYDTLLYEAISARLAAKMAYPITGSASKSQEMIQVYLAMIQEAKTTDGQEGTPETADITDLLDVR